MEHTQIFSNKSVLPPVRLPILHHSDDLITKNSGIVGCRRDYQYKSSMQLASWRRRKAAARPSFRLLRDFEVFFSGLDKAPGFLVQTLKHRGSEHGSAVDQLNSRHAELSSIQPSLPKICSTPPLTPPADVDLLSWTSDPANSNGWMVSCTESPIPITRDIFGSSTGNVSSSEQAGPPTGLSLETGGTDVQVETTAGTRLQPPMENSETGAWLDQSIVATGGYISG
jgi:hypothetical protein